MVDILTESCSALAVTSGEPLIGTAQRNNFHFVMAVPKRDWLDRVEAMDSPAGELARLIQPLKGQAILSLTCTPEDQMESIWLFPHRLRFDNLPPDDYPALIDQALTGNITLPHEQVSGIYMLLCTHGKRDQCCAYHGMALKAMLNDFQIDDLHVWESSHLGGHRFAATLVVQPEAHWYGNLRVEDAAGLLHVIQRGEVLLSHYRGNASYPPPLQVAEKWGWEKLYEQGQTGKINLVNPEIKENHARVEVSLDVEGQKQHYRLQLSGEPYTFVSGCDLKEKDRLIWRIVDVHPIEGTS